MFVCLCLFALFLFISVYYRQEAVHKLEFHGTDTDTDTDTDIRDAPIV